MKATIPPNSISENAASYLTANPLSNRIIPLCIIGTSALVTSCMTAITDAQEWGPSVN
jgi:hypothetical protein